MARDNGPAAGCQRGNGEAAAVDAGKALRGSQARYWAVVHQSADCIGLIDAAALHLLEATPAFFELLGCTEEELPEFTVYDIVAHDRAEVERARLGMRFLQMEKMEVIGQFTAGVAHNFSNTLAVCRAPDAYEENMKLSLSVRAIGLHGHRRLPDSGKLR